MVLIACDNQHEVFAIDIGTAQLPMVAGASMKPIWWYVILEKRPRQGSESDWLATRVMCKETSQSPSLTARACTAR